MKKITYLLLLLVLSLGKSSIISAQTKFGDNKSAINAGSLLELESTDKGFLPPRVALTDAQVWGLAGGLPVTGMIVYNTAAGLNGLQPGLLVWQYSQWMKLQTGSSGWNITGNAGTTSPVTVGTAAGTTNFLGTTDGKNLGMATNGITRVIIDTNANLTGGSGTANQTNNKYNLIWGLNDTAINSFGYSAIFGGNNTMGDASAPANSFVGANFISGYGNRMLSGVDGGIIGQNNTIRGSSVDNFITGFSNNISDGTGIGTGNNIISGSNNSLTGLPGYGGGYDNLVNGRFNKTSGNQGLVSGEYNTNDGATAIFMSGGNNYISAAGDGSAVFGGEYDSVFHTHSVAIGSHAATTRDNQFVASFTGGYHLIGIGSGAATDSVVTDSLGYIRHRSLAAINNNSWSLTGNAGTTAPASIGDSVAATNYLGTTDSKNLALATNGITRAILDTAGNLNGGIPGFVLSAGYASNLIWGSNTVTSAGNVVTGSGNVLTDDYNAVFGNNNTDSSIYGLVAGAGNVLHPTAGTSFVMGSFNDVAGSSNAVLGRSHTVARRSVSNVVGGILQRMDSTSYSAAFGASNTDSANYTIMGGHYNTIGRKGLSSAVFGQNNRVAGNYSFVTGTNSTATGYTSVAMGENDTASGYVATAIGSSNNASGFYSFAGGLSNRVSGNYSVSLGYNNVVTAGTAMAFGSFNVVNGSNAIALGGYPGYTNTASGLLSFVVGAGNTVSGTLATAHGVNNNVSSGNSHAFGEANVINATDRGTNFAFGQENTVTGYGHGCAFGYKNTTAGDCSAIFGAFNQSMFNGSFVIGASNAFRGGAVNQLLTTDAIFQIGNGGISNYSNALSVLRDGKMSIGTHTSIPTVALEINGTDGVKIPAGTTADRPAAPAFGTLRYNSELGRPEMYINDLNNDGILGDAGWLKL